MTDIQKYKPPKLALLEQKKKLRDYVIEERNTETTKLVVRLLSLLGVSPGKEVQWASLYKFINDVYLLSTYEEIDEAFDMYISNKFTLKPYQQLNAVVFGQVMREFEFYKKERLKEYRRKRKPQLKPLTPDEQKQLIRDAIKDEFENYKFSGELNANRNYLYDELINLGLDVEEKFKKVAWKHSITEVKKEQSQLNKRDRAEKSILKAKCIIRYKQKLVAIIFDRFTTYEQLKKKLLCK